MHSQQDFTHLKAYRQQHGQTDKYWSLLDVTLQDRKAAFAYVQDYIQSQDMEERLLAVDIAGQLCNPVEEHYNAKAHKLSALVLAAIDAPAEDRHFLIAALIACVYFEASMDWCEKIIEASFSKDDAVRLQAAITMADKVDATFGPLLTKRLAQLSRDKNGEIRSWAAFGIGTQAHIAEIEIMSEVLIELAKDKSPQVRDEAIMGLAYAHDERGILLLQNALKRTKDVSLLNIEAAGTYGVPDFEEQLHNISQTWQEDALLIDWAMRRCSPDLKIKASVAEEWV